MTIYETASSLGGPNAASDHKPVIYQIFEIRYDATPKILDSRGRWAEELKDALELPTWNIGTNRIDLLDSNRNIRCFLSHSNAGLVLKEPPTANYFPDHAVKFFKAVLGLEGFPKPLIVERIGVRQRFLDPFNGKFEELVERMTANYVTLTETAKRLMDARVIDVCAPFNFADKCGNFSTTCGPVGREQAQSLFGEEDELPGVSIFFDIDYWLRPQKEMKDQEILATIKTFANEGWSRHESIRDLILGAATNA